MCARARMKAPLRAVAPQMAFLLPILSATKPLETLAANPAAGISIEMNPAVPRVIPLNSTRKEGAKVSRDLRHRL